MPRRTRPPSAARSLRYTVRSYRACWSRRSKPGPGARPSRCRSTARAKSRAVSRGPLEQRAPARLLGRAQEVLVDLLEDRGDAVEIGRPERPQRRRQRLLAQVGLVAHQHAAAQAQPLDHQAVHVGERQEGEDRRLLARRGAAVCPQPGEQGVAGARQAAVGAARSPGDGPVCRRCTRSPRWSPAARCRRSESTVASGTVPARARRAAPAPPASNCQTCRSSGQRGAHRADRHHALLVLDDHAHTGGVPQDPLDLVARRRRIDRHDLGAHRPQRVASTVHSYRVRAMIATRLPGRIPDAINPLASSTTSSRVSAALTRVQVPGEAGSRRAICGRAG